jgi:hypothetical protein
MKLCAMAILAGLALGPCVKADTLDILHFSIERGDYTFMLPSQVVATPEFGSGEPGSLYEIFNIPVFVDFYDGGVTANYTMYLLPFIDNPDNRLNFIMSCWAANLPPSLDDLCFRGEVDMFLATDPYTVSGNTLTFIPGIYRAPSFSHLVIRDGCLPIPTPEPNALTLLALGLTVVLGLTRCLRGIGPDACAR